MTSDGHHVYFTFSENIRLNNGGEDVVVVASDVPLSSSLVQYHKIPLSEKARSFKMTVRSLAEGAFLMFGVNPKCYIGKPQWFSNSNIRYVSDTGGVFTGGPGLHSDQPYSKGDTVTCYLEQIFSEKTVVNFFKNGQLVYRQWVAISPEQLYATVGISRGAAELTVEWPQITGDDVTLSQTLMSNWHGFKYIGKDDSEETLTLEGYDEKERLAYSVQGPRPLDRSNSYFEIEIRSREDEDCGQGIGLSAAWTDKFRMPGWDAGTIGYHADDGGIYHDSGETRDCDDAKWKCVVGDHLGCGLVFPPDLETNDTFDEILVLVYFTKNKDVIYKRCRKQPLGGFYPKIGFTTKGDIVKVRFPEPILPPDDTVSFLSTSVDLYKDFRFTELLEFPRFEQNGGARVFLRPKESSVSTVQYTKEALTEKTGYFQIRLLEAEPNASVQIGAATSDFSLNSKSLGSNASSGGFLSSSGQLLFNSEKNPGSPWSVDKLIGCFVEYSTPICVILSFTCNGYLVGRCKLLVAEGEQVFATVTLANGPVLAEIDWPGRVSGKPSTDTGDMSTWIHNRSTIESTGDRFNVFFRDREKPEDVLWVMSPSPLTKSDREFVEFRVDRVSDNSLLGFGLASATSKRNRLLGLERGTIAYFPYIPEITCSNITTAHSTDPTNITDVFGVGVIRPESDNCRNQQSIAVYFTKNGDVFHHQVFQQQAGGVYLAIYLDHEGDSVEVIIEATPPDISDTVTRSWMSEDNSFIADQNEAFSADLMSDVMQYMPSIYDKDETISKPSKEVSGDRNIVYVCHCQENTDHVNELTEGLTDKFEVITSNCSEQLESRRNCILNSKAVIIMISEESLSSNDLRDECEIALDHTAQVLIVFLDDDMMEMMEWPPGGTWRHLADKFDAVNNSLNIYQTSELPEHAIEARIENMMKRQQVEEPQPPAPAVYAPPSLSPSRTISHVHPLRLNTPRTAAAMSRSCSLL